MSQQNTQQKQAAEATEQTRQIKGKIVEFAWNLKKEGYRESTIRRYTRGLGTLTNKKADLYNPESVKGIIAEQSWKEDTRLTYTNFYDTSAKFMGIEWKRPKYQTTRKIPFIPMEQEIDLLIHATGKRVSVVLQIIKETAMRIGEVLRLK